MLLLDKLQLKVLPDSTNSYPILDQNPYQFSDSGIWFYEPITLSKKSQHNLNWQAYFFNK